MTQDLYLAEWQAEAEQHDCGHPHDVCEDPERTWYPQRKICRVAMEQAAADRIYSELHEARPYHDGTFKNWVEKPSPAFPYHFSDGVTVFVAASDLNPDDDFLSPPEPLAATHSPDEPEEV